MAARKEAKHIAIFFALLSIALLAGAIWIPYRAPPVSFPLRLSTNYALERDMHLNRKGNYRISVYCSTSGDIAHPPDFLKGGNLVKIAVSENGVPLNLYYFSEPHSRPGIVSTDDWGNIASGPGRNELGQDIAEFAAEPERLYHIKCSVIRPVTKADQMKPNLVIWLDPLDAKGDILLSGFALLGAIFSALLAGIAAIVHFIVRRKRTYPISLETDP
jgi:hypothetical protein